MKSRIRNLGALTIAVFALLVVGAQAASAAGPTFTTENDSYTSVSGRGILEIPSLGTAVECQSDSNTGNTGNGTIGSATVTFETCAIPGGAKCTSAGQPEGTIKTSTLRTESVWIGAPGGEFGIRFTAPSGTFAEFSCGSTSIRVTGAVRGTVLNTETGEPLGLGEPVEQFTVALSPARGGQELMSAVTISGFPLGTFASTEETEDVVTLAEPGEFVE